ncbi:MAG TPA: aminopeptidase [Acidobacteriaceae bacterium]|nr:aminopeptidase [Acidobacteriaceae bacterium]
MENSKKKNSTSLSFEQKLDRLAEVAVRVGLGLGEENAPVQELVMSASIDALPLVRRITEHAYKAGATLVTTLYSDEESSLLRYRYAPDSSFDRVATWLQDGIAAAYRTGAARLAIAGGDPSLLAKQDPAKVGRANVAFSKASKPAMELITRHEINWTIVANATPAWARAVFPGEPEQDAQRKLWDAIFAASRADLPDPVAAWKTHGENLKNRVDFLNGKRFAALHFRGPGTDLRVGLAADHLWAGGGTRAGNGIYCQPNIPTEEVFTTPHKDRVEGTVRSSKPLSHQGTLIEDISVRFAGGRVVEAKAKTGLEVLERMINTDDGARRLGEVALVPHSSPIAQSGVLFWNTLFDENAASHIALGQAYSTCLIGGEKMDEAALAARGANSSLIHVDWMIGSGEMDVDGVDAEGNSQLLMRKGEWV